MKKDNPIIEEIVISPEKLAAYELKLKGNPNSPIQISSKGKNTIAKEMLGGVCSVCAKPPAKKVIYDAGAGAKLVERYCDKCFQRWVTTQEEEPILQTREDKVYLTSTNGIDQTLAIRMEDWKRSNKY